MENMDSRTLAALIGVVGITISSLLAAFGYCIKSRTALKKTKKLVLYHLLEIRHFLLISNTHGKEIVKDFHQVIDEFIQDKLNTEDSEDPEGNLQIIISMIEQYISNLVSIVTPSINEDFIKSYNDSLKELCTSSPLLAHKLKARDTFHSILRAQEEYSSKVISEVFNEKNGMIDSFVEENLIEENKKANQLLIADIDDDVLSVAWSCSALTYIKCRYFIKNNKPNAGPIDKNELYERLSDIFEKLEAQVNNASNAA